MTKSSISNDLLLALDTLKDLDIDISKIKRKSFIEIMHVFSNCSDFRKKYLCKYSYESMILMILVSKICWRAISYSDISYWCSENKNKLKKMGIITSDKTPSHDTFRRFIQSFDSASLQKETLDKIVVLFNKIAKCNNNYQKCCMEVINVDGKEFRGSGRKEGTNRPHGNLATLNIYETKSQCCIISKQITKKESEINAFYDLLQELDLNGKIITADAIQCQKKICKRINEKRGKYLIACKRNQASLLEDQKQCFEAFGSIASYNDEYLNKHIGIVTNYKRKNREFKIIKLKSKYVGLNWPNLKAYIEVKSKTHNKKETSNINYFITDLANDEIILETIENRWKIEGDYHYEKDKLLYEDSFRSESKEALKNMAVINSIILSFFKVVKVLYGLNSGKQAHMKIAANPTEVINNILSIINSKELINEIKKQMKIKNNQSYSNS